MTLFGYLLLASGLTLIVTGSAQSARASRRARVQATRTEGSWHEQPAEDAAA